MHDNGTHYGEAWEVARLRELSACLGRNPLLVQASTGNTSVKLGGVLWMKASGKWFVNAKQDGFFVDLDLDAVRNVILQGPDALSVPEAHCSKISSASIETAMHALLPHPVVVHLHSINTIAWAVRSDAPCQLTQRLSGLAWQWIPYSPSGARLAREVEKAYLREMATNVFVLGNHGLVVCGESCQEVADLLNELEGRLALIPRQAPAPDFTLLDQLADSATWRLPDSDTLHALATDEVTRRILAGGVLYPCQAIFLPASVPSRSRVFERADSERDAFWIVDGAGVLIRHDITPTELEMLAGLTHIVQRVACDAPIRYLTQSEIESVLSKEAFQYRRLADANSCTQSR
jgi:rhamnose utilization protein RhaD (predicted bifunctional aldolase and dehydrogenase)